MLGVPLGSEGASATAQCPALGQFFPLLSCQELRAEGAESPNALMCAPAPCGGLKLQKFRLQMEKVAQGGLWPLASELSRARLDDIPWWLGVQLFLPWCWDEVSDLKSLPAVYFVVIL